MTKHKFAGKALLLLVVLMVAAAGTIKADDGQRSDLESMRRQVDLLQRAFAPKTPQEAVEKWAAAVKARNGAAQFAVLSPRLRQNLQSEFEALMWVTGTSSPWVDHYAIVGERALAETELEYILQFTLATSAGPAGTYTVELTVSQDPEGYFITRIHSEIDGLFPSARAEQQDRTAAGRANLEWRVDPLPADNLIENPWFRIGDQPSLAGWVEATPGPGGWTASQKQGNPTPDDVIGTAARISTGRGDTRTGWTVDSGVDAVLYQIVAADPAKRTLKFDMFWVAHTINPAKVTVFGGDSEKGPWTELWQPFYQVYTQVIRPESKMGNELWRYYSSTTDLATITLDRGYPFYKVEISGNLPDEKGGLKITGVYFTVCD
ncbi:MAG: hypothetical protein WBK33_05220 [Limnochordia bacterium]